MKNFNKILLLLSLCSITIQTRPTISPGVQKYMQIAQKRLCSNVNHFHTPSLEQQAQNLKAFFRTEITTLYNNYPKHDIESFDNPTRSFLDLVRQRVIVDPNNTKQVNHLDRKLHALQKKVTSSAQLLIEKEPTTEYEAFIQASLCSHITYLLIYMGNEIERIGKQLEK